MSTYQLNINPNLWPTALTYFHHIGDLDAQYYFSGPILESYQALSELAAERKLGPGWKGTFYHN